MVRATTLEVDREEGATVSVLQLWIVLGIPVVVGAVALLVGGSPARARAALILLVVFAAVLVFFAGGGPSIAVLAVPVVILVASGRLEGPRRLRHHETRHRLTRVGGV
jgi:hypothetical protein